MKINYIQYGDNYGYDYHYDDIGLFILAIKQKGKEGVIHGSHSQTGKRVSLCSVVS